MQKAQEVVAAPSPAFIRFREMLQCCYNILITNRGPLLRMAQFFL
jgi:hypothetical protein